MSKATPADLEAEGFDRKNFGFQPNAAGWNDAPGYLQKVLDEASAWAQSRVGAAPYASAVSPGWAFYALRRAELCFARMVLWNRRAAFLDGAAVSDHHEGAYAERSAYIKHAQSAMECADSAITEAMQALGIDPAAALPGTGSSVGYIETGRFPLATAEALNA